MIIHKIFENIHCFLFAGICLLISAVHVQAQPVLSPANLSLGGGGTAYINGPEASLWNPANLVINNRAGNFHLNLGQTSFIHYPVLALSSFKDQANSFGNSFFFPHDPTDTFITDEQRNSILTNNYPHQQLTSQHQSRADILLGGALVQGKNSAFSLTARARMGSHIKVGRGWYSDEFISSDRQDVRDMTLIKQKSQLYEFSLGYAREFTIFNGLFSHLSKLYVGIAPKFVISGPFIDYSYNNRFIQSEESNQITSIQDFSYQSTGSFSNTTKAYQAGYPIQQARNDNFNRRYTFEPTGYGGAVDFGLTYLIPLGGDLSILSPGEKNSVVTQSLRFSLSINDIGFVNYQKEPLKLSNSHDNISVENPPPVNSQFTGADGQIIHFVDSAEDIANPLLNSSEIEENSYLTSTPTSVNAGMLMELSRIKVVSDLTIGMENTAFTSKKLKVHLGLEIRPLPQVPLRAGTQLAVDQPLRLAAGTGIETRYWDLLIGSQLIYRTGSFETEIASAAVAGIQLHL